MVEQPVPDEYRHRTLPVLGTRVLRLGLAGSFGIDEAAVEWALDEGGINYVYWTPRMRQVTPALRRALKRDRSRYVVATGPTTALTAGGLRRFVDRARQRLDVDQLDVLQMHWLGVTSRWAPSTINTLEELRASAAVRAVGVSIHDRERAGQLATNSPLDVLMIRYNAAHPGAEEDIFPHLTTDRPRAVVAYTATCWRLLLKRPKGWSGPIPTAGDCYRFCLNADAVDVVLTGPASRSQLQDNLAALERGPLEDDEMASLRELGARVKRRHHRWI